MVNGGRSVGSGRWQAGVGGKNGRVCVGDGGCAGGCVGRRVCVWGGQIVAGGRVWGDRRGEREGGGGLVRDGELADGEVGLGWSK